MSPDSSVQATAFFTSIAKCTIKKSLVSLNPQGRVNNYVSISNKINPRRLQSFTLFGIFRKIYNHRDGSHLVPPKVGHFFQLTKFPPYIFHFSEALTGDYKGVDHSGAWEKMINYCEKENRVGCIDAEHISVYLDDPMTTPAEKGGHFDRLSDRRGEFKVRCPAGITAGQRRRCRARAYSYIH